MTSEQEPLPGGGTLTTLRGSQPGPMLALLGGIHGDEDVGVLAVRHLIHALSDRSFAGTVRAVAAANPPAWAAQSRTTPLDGANLARCFPGDLHGGPTPAMAAGLTEKVITGADLLIDLHSAGVNYDMPRFCGFVRGAATASASERLARAFGAPVIWEHPTLPPGRSLAAAADRGIPAVYVECSGGGGIRSDDLAAYVGGVLAVMGEVGMLSAEEPDSARGSEAALVVYGDGDLDAGAQAAHPGLFVTSVEPGTVVGAGDTVGELFSYQGLLLEQVRPVRVGMVMFLRRQARVRTGDVLFCLAAPKKPAR